MRMLIALATAFLTLAAAAPAGAAQVKVTGVKISAVGLYKTDVLRTVAMASKPGGKVNVIGGVHALKEGKKVRGTVGTVIGFTAEIEGSPRGVGGIQLTAVIDIPQPGMKDPTSGKTLHQIEEHGTVQIGSKVIVGYELTDAWKVVPGVWTWHILYKGKELARQSITVLAP